MQRRREIEARCCSELVACQRRNEPRPLHTIGIGRVGRPHEAHRLIPETAQFDGQGIGQTKTVGCGGSFRKPIQTCVENARLVPVHDPVISLRRKQVTNEIDREATDDLIRNVFEIDVRVQRHSDGTPLVLPQLMTAAGPKNRETA